MDWRYGWYVLAFAILSPKYCCPEEAYVLFFENKRLRLEDWVTDDMFDEMKNLKKEIGGKKTAECFGISVKHFYKIMKRRN